jgi:hypothetical protein
MGLQGVLGQSPAVAACAGPAQDRCPRLPVAATVAQLWSADGLVPAGRPGGGGAQLSAAEPVVLDDLDRLYASRDGVRLLKCLTQSEPVKRVSWCTGAATLQREQIPQEFGTTSQVAIITNQWKTLNRDVAALQDRGHVVIFQPSALEVHVRTAEWFWDQEIFDFLGEP